LTLPSSAFGQATRTFVSGVGDDVNPCSRTAPCKTWAGAISKTAAGGEMNALDPGGFGALTITKGITVDGGGMHASSLFAFTSGMIININPAFQTKRDVVIRNVSLNGTGTTLGTRGIAVLQHGARSVHIEGVQIKNFSDCGVCVSPGDSGGVTTTGAGTKVTVTDTSIADSTGNGIEVEGTDTSGTPATSSVTVRNASIYNHAGNGVRVKPIRTARVALFDSLIADNGGAGVQVEASRAEARIGGNRITGNGQGLQIIGAGELFSFGDNYIRWNAIDGVPTAVEGPS
jgi:hypothetical protein